MSTVKKTKFGILGCGVIAEIHANAIHEIEEAELVAICEKNEEKGRQFADKHGGQLYVQLEDMLQNDEIEVVCICTPSGYHAEQTLLAARAGKHVVVEKPMAIHMEDAYRMIRECKEQGVLLATIFPRRMSPAAQFVKQFIADGGLGKLSLCDAYVKIYRSQQYYDSAGWRGTWAIDGGGSMMNQGIHTVDLLQWLVGPVKSIYGRANTMLRQIEVEDTAVSLLSFHNGAMGVMEITTTVYPDLGQRLEIHGERGTLIYKEDDIELLKVNGEELEIPAFEPFQVIPDGHRLQLRDMALAVQEHRAPIIPGEEGIHALEIILGTYESSNRQSEVVLDKPHQSLKVENLQVNVYRGRRELGAAAGRQAAQAVRKRLAEQERVRIVFAAAPSQNEFLEQLCREEGLDWERITAFHMDEYIGLPQGSPQRFAEFLNSSIFDKVNPGVVHLIDGSLDAEMECHRYAELLQEAPIDFVFLGIGENGHIAFNDPPVADFADLAIIKPIVLEDACRQQQVNDGCFPELQAVPTHALTLTIPALMSASELFCMVPGLTKREAVHRTLNMPITTANPSTILRTHPSCTLYVDQDSFGESLLSVLSK
jgi:UDP-N-acetyl-2-amino-2-deoxyglucuronate dehydrogenase